MTRDIPARTAYERWAAIYDSNDNLTRDLDAQVLRGADLPLNGAFVVELGAGTGKNTDFIAGHARRIVALDLSPAMLEKARERTPGDHVHFIEHNILKPWPVEDGDADLVIGNLVLEHVEALAPVFTEAARVLRPGGLLFISELHPERQKRGSQARFEEDGEARFVEAYTHTLSDYVMAGEGAGLELSGIQEAIEAEAADDPETPPRILALTFEKPLGQK